MSEPITPQALQYLARRGAVRVTLRRRRLAGVLEAAWVGE
jgi:hypothetical protein